MRLRFENRILDRVWLVLVAFSAVLMSIVWISIWTERVGGRVVAAFIVGLIGTFIYDRLSNPANNRPRV